MNYINFIMTNITEKYEAQYRKILKECMQEGTWRNDRTKVGCYSVFNKSIKVDLSEAFPLITGRRMYPKIFKTEFEWFINGETNIKRFKDNKVTIWNEWADSNGDLGPVYGHQLRNFNDQSIDQLEDVIDSLKLNPDSRRHVVSLWNPAQLNEMALPPCYLYFQFFVNWDPVNGDSLNMFALQRSGDVFLGIPYDVALFSQILLYISEKVNIKPGKMEMQIIDAHVYENQIEAVDEYLQQPILPQPSYSYSNGQLTIKDYMYGPVITAPVAV